MTLRKGEEANQRKASHSKAEDKEASYVGDTVDVVMKGKMTKGVVETVEIVRILFALVILLMVTRNTRDQRRTCYAWTISAGPR